MNHQRYAPEAFEPDGTLAINPSYDVVSVLGKYGMAHPLMSDAAQELSTASGDAKLLVVEERMREAQKLKAARIRERFYDFKETPEGKKFVEMYEAVYRDVSSLTELVGEKPPTLEDSPFLEALPSLLETYTLFDKLWFEPQLVLAPIHHTQEWWQDLALAFEDSPLNPRQPNSTRRAIANGGLAVSGGVSNSWKALTDCGLKPPSWSLCVMLGSALRFFAEATSYGYADPHNEKPHVRLNNYLKQMGHAEVVQRDANEPPIPLDIHPTIEEYMMHQFTRALNIRTQTPLDAGSSWTWLRCLYGLNNNAPVGLWDSNTARLILSEAPNNMCSNTLHIRLTSRGNPQ